MTLRKIVEADAHRGFTMPTAKKISNAALRQHAEAAAFRRMTKSEPPRRVEFGEVNAGRHGRLRASFDQGADVISIHGVNIDLHDIDDELASGFRYFSAAFLDSLQDAQAQAAWASYIGLFVERAIDGHDFIASAVSDAKRRIAA